MNKNQDYLIKFDSEEVNNMQVRDFIQEIDFAEFLKSDQLKDLSKLDIESAIKEMEESIIEINETKEYQIDKIEEAENFKSPFLAIGFYVAKNKFLKIKMYDILHYVKQSDLDGKESDKLEFVFNDLHLGFTDFELLRFYQYEINILKRIRDLYKEKLPVIPNTKKLGWSGTPGEFGAIFNLLFDNGYIDIVKDKANMVRVLNEIFEIKNDTGNTVSEKYLYKCFGEKEKKYNPGQLKIPFSDNYHTGK